MNSTITIRLPEELATWIEKIAETTGQTRSEVVRMHLEHARLAREEKPWMKLIGCMEGPPDLSMREGFGPR